MRGFYYNKLDSPYNSGNNVILFLHRITIVSFFLRNRNRWMLQFILRVSKQTKWEIKLIKKYGMVEIFSSRFITILKEKSKDNRRQ